MNEYGIRVLGICDDDLQKELNKNNNNKAVFLHCQCHCGKEFNTRQQNIKKIKSCGCSRNKLKQKGQQVIGEKYGRLTIVGVDEERTAAKNKDGKHGGLFVMCKCECGNIKSYHYGSVKSGHTISCGCSKINNPKIMHDLTGKKFGRLTVVRRDIERDSSANRKGNVHWLCKCDCGNPKLSSVTGYCLENGHTQSCGCLASEAIAKRNKRVSTKYNKADVSDDVVKIYGEDGSFFIVDREDYDYVKNWFWRKDQKGYWITNSKKEDVEIYNKKMLRVHQLIAARKYGEYNTKILFPDHLSRDKSDNRRCNLILKSNMDNMKNRSISKANTSGKTGVCFAKSKGLWTAFITINYETIYLGDYQQYEDAVKARLKAEEKYGFTCDDKVAAYDVDLNKNEELA